MRETGKNDLSTRLEAQTVLEAISYKHKKIILMGSTEKLPKSFHLGNKVSGTKIAIIIAKKKKAILQFHLLKQKFHKIQ